MHITKEQVRNTQTLDGLAVIIEITTASTQPDKDTIIQQASQKILEKATVDDYKRYKKYLDPIL